MALNKEKTGSLDMTKGSPFKLILTFSLPLLAGNALQQMYNMVDSMVVGQFVGSGALVAVSASFPIIFLLTSIFMGLGNGAMVMVSQYYGGGETEHMQNTIDTVYTAMMVGIVPITILGIVCANPILTLIQIPQDAREESYIYLVIIMAGLIGGMGYNTNAGILQGMGDSKTPLLFLAIACGINIGLDLLLVLVIPMGVAGVAIATIFSQFISWIFGVIYINRKYPDVRVRPFSFKFHKHLFKEIIRLGIPAAIQNTMFSAGTLVMTRLVNQFGSIFSAGFGAANKLDTFVFLPIQSLAMAVTSYTGQNIGAGKLHRVKDGSRASLLMAVGFSLIGLLVIPLGPTMLRLFTGDPAVIEAGMAYLVRIIPFYWMLAISFILNSVMRGAGEAIVPMVSSAISMLLVRVPTSYLFAGWFGRDNLNFSYMAGWAVGLAITIPYYFSGRWKNKAITQAGSNMVAEEAALNREAQALDKEKAELEESMREL